MLNPLTGPNYRDAHLAKIQLPEEEMKKLSAWVQKPTCMLVFLGTPGVGKTYFCSALMNHFIERNSSKPVYHRMHFRYYSERQFFASLREVISKGWDYERAIEHICETPFILIDDIGSSQATEWQKEALFSVIDNRSQTNLPTIFTSNLFLEDMKNEYSKRMYSRIACKDNCIIQLNGEDRRL